MGYLRIPFSAAWALPLLFRSADLPNFHKIGIFTECEIPRSVKNSLTVQPPLAPAGRAECPPRASPAGVGDFHPEAAST